MAEITVRCNPPKGYRGDIRFIFGINDENIGEGAPGDEVRLTMPAGVQNVLVLVTNGSLNSLTGETRLEIKDGLRLRCKYSLFTKKATLMIDD